MTTSEKISRLILVGMLFGIPQGLIIGCTVGLLNGVLPQTLSWMMANVTIRAAIGLIIGAFFGPTMAIIGWLSLWRLYWQGADAPPGSAIFFALSGGCCGALIGGLSGILSGSMTDLSVTAAQGMIAGLFLWLSIFGLGLYLAEPD
jgi:hypothetical protein